MGSFVIAVYKPRPGKQAELEAVVARHWPVLRNQNLITERPAYIMRAADGTIIEVFEWLSLQAIDDAHTNPEVQKLWTEFGEVCEYVPIGSLPEAQHPFSGFEAVTM